jgi:antitoxin YefM
MQERVLKFSDTRENLATELDHVVNDHVALKIVRKRGNVVVISEEDYASLEETAYLLSSPKNAKRLMASVTRKSKLTRYKSVHQLKSRYGI